jgi:hypothetical protein
LEGKKRLSITGGLLIFFLVGATIVVAYNYWGKASVTAEGTFSILFVTVYVDDKNKSVLSIELANTGSIDLTVTSVKVGEEVVKLSAVAIFGCCKLGVGTRMDLQVPLNGTYIVGNVYDLSVETDPPAIYTPIQTGVVYKKG